MVSGYSEFKWQAKRSLTWKRCLGLPSNRSPRDFFTKIMHQFLLPHEICLPADRNVQISQLSLSTGRSCNIREQILHYFMLLNQPFFFLFQEHNLSSFQ